MLFSPRLAPVGHGMVPAGQPASNCVYCRRSHYGSSGRRGSRDDDDDGYAYDDRGDRDRGGGNDRDRGGGNDRGDRERRERHTTSGGGGQSSGEPSQPHRSGGPARGDRYVLVVKTPTPYVAWHL